MKASILLSLLTLIVLLSVLETRGDAMKEETQTLMDALKVEPASNRQLPDLSDRLFPGQFPVMDGYMVRRTGMLSTILDPPQSSMQVVDANGEVQGYLRVMYARSPKTAQRAIFEKIAMSSAPMELLINGNKIDADGAGDIHVADTAGTRTFFARGNVAVEIRSRKPDFNFQSVARIMDAMILSALLSSDDPAARAAVLESIEVKGKRQELPMLLVNLYATDRAERHRAIAALGELDDESSLVALDLWKKNVSTADEARPAKDKWIDDAMANRLEEAKRAIQAKLEASKE